MDWQVEESEESFDESNNEESSDESRSQEQDEHSMGKTCFWKKFLLLDSGDDMSVDTVNSSDDDPNTPATSRLIRRLWIFNWQS